MHVECEEESKAVSHLGFKTYNENANGHHHEICIVVRLVWDSLVLNGDLNC